MSKHTFGCPKKGVSDYWQLTDKCKTYCHIYPTVQASFLNRQTQPQVSKGPRLKKPEQGILD